MQRLAVCALLFAIACTGSGHGKVGKPPPPARADASEVNVIKKTPDSAVGATFVRGAPLTPADQLIAWLDDQTLNGEPRLVRLPLVLGKGQVGFSLRGAKLGSAADAVVVYANDSALGIGLGDRARKCKDHPTCSFLVEAYWRGKQDGDYSIDVMKASAPFGPDEFVAVTHAEVEGESGN